MDLGVLKMKTFLRYLSLACESYIILDSYNFFLNTKLENGRGIV